MVRRPAEEERRRDPEVRQARDARGIHECGLDEHGFGGGKFRDTSQHADVRLLRVARRVVREEEVEAEDDGRLEADRDVDRPPGGVLGDDAGEDAGDEHAEEEEAGDSNRDRGLAPVRRGEVGGQREDVGVTEAGPRKMEETRNGVNVGTMGRSVERSVERRTRRSVS
jgi:hypothetical protein